MKINSNVTFITSLRACLIYTNKLSVNLSFDFKRIFVFFSQRGAPVASWI